MRKQLFQPQRTKSYCSETNLAPATVLTYVSAISYYHKIRTCNFFDPTQNFVVKKCLQGYQKIKQHKDTRKPITSSILSKLIAFLSHTTNSHFIRFMMRAVYLLAFYAMLRVGEFTTCLKATAILYTADIKFVHENKPVSVAFEIHISGYNHSPGKTVLLLIESHSNLQECPVHSLWQYFQLRGSNTGPLLSLMGGSPVSRSFFTQQLNLSLIWAGCNTKLYNTHSLRIG